MVAAELAQVAHWVEPLDASLRARLLSTWPGFLTWRLPARRACPPWLTGGSAHLAVRVSAHLVVSGLCRRFGGPLVSTSANPAGRPPARSALQVRGYFGGRVAYVLAGPLGGERRPSEIRDAITGAVLRPGAA